MPFLCWHNLQSYFTEFVAQNKLIEFYVLFFEGPYFFILLYLVLHLVILRGALTLYTRRWWRLLDTLWQLSHQGIEFFLDFYQITLLFAKTIPNFSEISRIPTWISRDNRWTFSRHRLRCNLQLIARHVGPRLTSHVMWSILKGNLKFRRSRIDTLLRRRRRRAKVTSIFSIQCLQPSLFSGQLLFPLKLLLEESGVFLYNWHEVALENASLKRVGINDRSRDDVPERFFFNVLHVKEARSVAYLSYEVCHSVHELLGVRSQSHVIFNCFRCNFAHFHLPSALLEHWWCLREKLRELIGWFVRASIFFGCFLAQFWIIFLYFRRLGLDLYFGIAATSTKIFLTPSFRMPKRRRHAFPQWNVCLITTQQVPTIITWRRTPNHSIRRLSFLYLHFYLTGALLNSQHYCFNLFLFWIYI